MNKDQREKKQILIKCLDDADRRFNIAISKMSEITKRVHELEINRNFALKNELLLSEIQYYKNNPRMIKTLTKELNNTDNKYVLVYQEVIQGYRSMSRRKNDLEEERNIYVKDIEAII